MISASQVSGLQKIVEETIFKALSRRPKSQWRGVKEQARRLGVSERTLRGWLGKPVNPLPCSRVDGGKLLINDADADRWLRAQATEHDLDALAAKALKGF